MSKPIKQEAKSPLRYPGGKQKAIKYIAEVLPKNAYEYREPMVGGGSVFLYAKQKSFAQIYWINDKLKELISFWKAVQNESSCVSLMSDLEALRQSFDSADEIKKYFHSVRRTDTKDQYQQALLFFFFNRVTFSGTTQAGGFSPKAGLNRFTLSSINRLQPLSAILTDAKITDGDYEEMITEPGRDTFLFLDPPHYQKAKIYGPRGTYNEFDHAKLAELLRNTNHRFLITADDCPEIRELYSWANLRPWSLTYGMTNCNTDHLTKTGAELFITNYDISTS